MMAPLKTIIAFIFLALPSVISTLTSSVVRRAPTAIPSVVGCFSSHQALTKQDSYEYQSSGHCWGVCSDRSNTVLGLSNGVSCWCGNELPPVETKVSDSLCSTPCQGYDVEDCGGGTEYFTIWLTGIEANVPHADPSSTSPSASPTKTAPSLNSPSSGPPFANPPPSDRPSSNSPSSNSPSSKTTISDDSSAGAKTKASALPTSSKSDDSSQHSQSQKDSKKRGVILGVVLGLTALIALIIIALLLWYMCRRRRWTRSYVRHQEVSCLSNKPWRSRVDSHSIDASSTYSTELLDPVRDGQTTTALHTVPLASNAPARDRNVTSGTDGITSPVFLGLSPNSRVSSIESEAEKYRNVIDAQPFAPSSAAILSSSSLHDTPENYVWSNLKHLASVSENILEDKAFASVSPTTNMRSNKQIRSLIVHYPSRSEMDGFDFASNADNPSIEQQRGSWHSWRERKDGRHELA